MQSGDVVGGRYRLAEPLASGGMGTVWRARHVELDVDVAVKVMSKEMMAAPNAAARFKREARAAARLRSPHIVQVMDYGLHEEQPYLAMELLDGEDLGSRLDRQGALSPTESRIILEAVGKALQLAHDADLVHRDLKPENIFIERVGEDEVVKVLDFGIAKDLVPGADGVETTNGLLGSPAYMSPEQILGNDLDPRTDLWSLAVVLFEMLTGDNPFLDDRVGRVFLRITTEELPRYSDHAHEEDPALDAFFERALAREVDARFATVRELVDGYGDIVGSDRARSSVVSQAATSDPAPRTRLRSSGGVADTVTTADTVAVDDDAREAMGSASSTFAPGMSDRTGERRRGAGALWGAVLGGMALVVALVFALRSQSPAGDELDPAPATSAGAPEPTEELPESAPDAPSALASAAPSAGAAPVASASASNEPARTAVALPSPPPRVAAPPPPAPAPPQPPRPEPTPDPMFGVPMSP